MKCDLFVLAEGVTADARGALTLVGVNQRAIATASLPFSVRQKIVISLTDEVEGPAGHEFAKLPDGDLTIRVTDPSGTPQFAISQNFKMPKEDMPAMMPKIANIIADIVISGTSYGEYTAQTTFRTTDGEEFSREFPIYVVPAPSPSK
ncbi:MAG: hypothetical protein J2P25_00750 [Nocardiopsaceae bacterium]|nr:hypothetical protein [Nocardiopsaceae bacterium]